ncbi:hypothetical protein K7432_005808 [Basidiobolus ranarum]|uniref:Uncharacterized protein n=1 Tax=Basidiobolus ranarum TaxID=34480 RepID=A0ABR2W2P0_9FUNG
MQLTITKLLTCAALVQVVYSTPVNYLASTANPSVATSHSDVLKPEASTQLPSTSKQKTQIPVWKHVFTTISRKQKDPNTVETIMKKESSFEYQTAPSAEIEEESTQPAYGNPDDLKNPTDSGSEQISQELPYAQPEPEPELDSPSTETV